jgi:hypothetical protein
MSDPNYPPQRGANTGLIVAGYICAFLCTIAGIVIGVLVLNKGDKGNGWGIIGLSIAVSLVGLVIAVS